MSNLWSFDLMAECCCDAGDIGILYIYNNDARNDELFFRLGRMRVLFIILSALC